MVVVVAWVVGAVAWAKQYSGTKTAAARTVSETRIVLLPPAARHVTSTSWMNGGVAPGSATREKMLLDVQWAGAESNRRHMDFQSIALPAELPARRSRAQAILDQPEGFARSSGGAPARRR